MREQIIKHLEDGGRVVVGQVWHFQGLEMECTENMELRDTDHCCCEELYESYEEVWTAILDFCDSQFDDVEFL